jgi:hypothetical protein
MPDKRPFPGQTAIRGAHDLDSVRRVDPAEVFIRVKPEGILEPFVDLQRDELTSMG